MFCCNSIVKISKVLFTFVEPNLQPVVHVEGAFEQEDDVIHVGPFMDGDQESDKSDGSSNTD